MTGLMAGKRGLVMGVANDHSIAWGIARASGPKAPNWPSHTRARPWAPGRAAAQTLGSSLVPCDVEDLASVDATFAALDEAWPEGFDFVVHASASPTRRSSRAATSTSPPGELFPHDGDLVLLLHEAAQRAAKRMRPAARC